MDTDNCACDSEAAAPVVEETPQLGEVVSSPPAIDEVGAMRARRRHRARERRRHEALFLVAMLALIAFLTNWGE